MENTCSSPGLGSLPEFAKTILGAFHLERVLWIRILVMKWNINNINTKLYYEKSCGTK